MFGKRNTLCVSVYLFIFTAPVLCNITAIPACTRGEIWTSGVTNYELTYEGQATHLGLTFENINNCSRDCCMSRCNYEKGCHQISQSEKSSCWISSDSTISHVAQDNMSEWLTFNKCRRGCEAGFESVEGSPCTMCIAGKYKHEAGISDCINCSSDTFSETVGSVENDCQTCNRNTYTMHSGASSASECACNGEFVVDCCGICFSFECIQSTVYFEFEGSISTNEMSTNQNFIFAQHGSVDYSSCVPSGGMNNDCSRVTLYNAVKDTNFSLSKTILGDNHVVLNYGLGSLYEMNTPGLAVSLWVMYDDNGPGNGQIFLQSGNFKVSHPPLSTKIHIGTVIVDAEMHIWHNVFLSSDHKKCLNVWFNSKHVCKCCSKTEFIDTNDNIELLGHIESKGVYVDDLRLYSEPIYFQEKCDLEMMCGAGSESLDAYTCSECTSGKYKQEVHGICENCMEGTYSSLSGMSSCINCPVNTYSPSKSMSLSSCLCDAGYSNTYSDSCVECVVGKYKEHAGNSVCIDCQSNTYSQEPGSGICNKCPINTNSLSGSNDITKCMCNIGTTGPDGGSCVDCMSGKYKDIIGSSSCVNCEMGKYSNMFNTCEQCPLNTMSIEGSNDITKCICNIGTTGPDGGSCVDCMSGKYKDIIGSSSCVNCEMGKYSNVFNTCEQCPQNTISVEGSNNKLQCICVEGTDGPQGGPCIVMFNESFLFQTNSTKASQITIELYSTTSPILLIESTTSTNAKQTTTNIHSTPTPILLIESTPSTLTENMSWYTSTNAKQTTTNINSTPTLILLIESTPSITADNVSVDEPFFFVTTVSFELYMDNIFISNDMKTTIRLETSKQMEIDILRIGLLKTNHNQTRRRNLLSIEASFKITSTLKTESLRIEREMSLHKLNSILSVGLNRSVNVTNLYIFTVKEQHSPNVVKGRNIVLIISIIGSSIVLLIIIILIITCVCTHRKKKNLQGASFDIVSCEYCTICNGKFEERH